MSILREYLQQSSFHGLHFIANRQLHITERIFWLLCVLACWSGSVYLMYSSMQLTYEKPITLSVNSHHLHWFTRFPAVVVCETGNKYVLQEAIRLFADNPSKYLQKKKNLEQTVFFDGTLTDNMLVNYPGNMSYYRSLRGSCADIFNYCAWNRKEFICCDHFRLLETVFGPCFAVNSIHTNKTKLQFKMEMGRKTATLELEFKNPKVNIYAVSNEEIPTYTTTPIAKPTEYYEYRVFMTISETITAPDVRQIEVARRKCRFPDENFLDVAKYYTFESCKLQCQKKEHLLLYNCTHLYMPYAKQKEICNDQQLIRLANGFVQWTKEVGKICNCELSCQGLDVAVPSTINFKVTDLTETKWKNGTLSHILINCDPTHSKVLRNKAKNILDSIVSLGGTAGLFVGASILSIVELVYYFTIRAVDNKIIRRLSRRRHRQRQQMLANRIVVYPFMN